MSSVLGDAFVENFAAGHRVRRLACPFRAKKWFCWSFSQGVARRPADGFTVPWAGIRRPFRPVQAYRQHRRLR